MTKKWHKAHAQVNAAVQRAYSICDQQSALQLFAFEEHLTPKQAQMLMTQRLFQNENGFKDGLEVVEPLLKLSESFSTVESNRIFLNFWSTRISRMGCAPLVSANAFATLIEGLPNLDHELVVKNIQKVLCLDVAAVIARCIDERFLPELWKIVGNASDFEDDGYAVVFLANVFDRGDTSFDVEKEIRSILDYHGRHPNVLVEVADMCHFVPLTDILNQIRSCRNASNEGCCLWAAPFVIDSRIDELTEEIAGEWLAQVSV